MSEYFTLTISIITIAHMKTIPAAYKALYEHELQSLVYRTVGSAAGIYPQALSEVKEYIDTMLREMPDFEDLLAAMTLADAKEAEIKNAVARQFINNDTVLDFMLREAKRQQLWREKEKDYRSQPTREGRLDIENAINEAMKGFRAKDYIEVLREEAGREGFKFDSFVETNLSISEPLMHRESKEKEKEKDYSEVGSASSSEPSIQREKKDKMKEKEKDYSEVGASSSRGSFASLKDDEKMTEEQRARATEAKRQGIIDDWTDALSEAIGEGPEAFEAFKKDALNLYGSVSPNQQGKMRDGLLALAAKPGKKSGAEDIERTKALYGGRESIREYLETDFTLGNLGKARDDAGKLTQVVALAKAIVAIRQEKDIDDDKIKVCWDIALRSTRAQKQDYHDLHTQEVLAHFNHQDHPDIVAQTEKKLRIDGQIQKTQVIEPKIPPSAKNQYSSPKLEDAYTEEVSHAIKDRGLEGKIDEKIEELRAYNDERREARKREAGRNANNLAFEYNIYAAGTAATKGNVFPAVLVNQTTREVEPTEENLVILGAYHKLMMDEASRTEEYERLRENIGINNGLVHCIYTQEVGKDAVEKDESFYRVRKAQREEAGSGIFAEDGIPGGQERETIIRFASNPSIMEDSEGRLRTRFKGKGSGKGKEKLADGEEVEELPRYPLPDKDKKPVKGILKHTEKSFITFEEENTDITEQKGVSAIVSSGSRRMRGEGDAAGHVLEKGGSALVKNIKKAATIPVTGPISFLKRMALGTRWSRQNLVKEGECIVTGAGNLKDQGIERVYTVAAIDLRGRGDHVTTELQREFTALYKNLFRAVDPNDRNIAIPVLSSGVFKGEFSPEQVAELNIAGAHAAYREVNKELAEAGKSPLNIGITYVADETYRPLLKGEEAVEKEGMESTDSYLLAAKKISPELARRYASDAIKKKQQEQSPAGSWRAGSSGGSQVEKLQEERRKSGEQERQI